MHQGVLYPPSQQLVASRHEAFASRLPSTPPTRRPCLVYRRRPCTTPCTAVLGDASSSTQPNPEQKRVEITANVERAAAIVGEIVDEVTRELFVSEAVAYIQSDRTDQTELSAVREAVTRRLDFLDANFLTTLGAFIRACEQRGDAQLGRLLGVIREEVLHQVAGRMPAAAQVLDLALRHADKDERVAVLRAAAAAAFAAEDSTGASPTYANIPAADLDTLAATASKFIDEMEEQAEIPDRRLLARLVLLREEVRLLREEVRFSGGPDQRLEPEPVRSNVPQRCAAFLKELVAVSDPLRRVGLLAAAFERDWDGAAPRQKPHTAFHANQPDWVRPGRFMATLQSMVVQLQTVDAGGTGGDGGGGNVAVVARLEAIRSEAMAVLDRMHTAGIAGGGSGAGRGDGGYIGGGGGYGLDGGEGDQGTGGSWTVGTAAENRSGGA